MVAEDEQHLAILDAYPKTVGHVLVIPKAHISYVFDMADPAYTALMLFTKRVAEKLKLVSGAERVMKQRQHRRSIWNRAVGINAAL